jgi:hypothetical protein
MTTPVPVVPDYWGASICNLVPALLEPPGRRPAWLPEPAQEASQIALLLLDGLGWLQLQQRRHLAPTLVSMPSRSITSVAPSTTAVALTSLTVGRPPAQHGIVGFRVVVGGAEPEVMNVLRWRTPSGDARSRIRPREFQPLTPFGGRRVPVVSRADLAGSAFTEAHNHDSPVVGWAAASAIAVDTGHLLAGGEPLVYAYYDGIDKTAHLRGFGEHFDAELKAADRLVGELLGVLPPGAALVVTSDHGQVEVGERAAPMAAAVMEHLFMTSGEARFRWLHAKPGREKQLAETAKQLYSAEAWVASIDEVEHYGWLGGPLSSEVRSRLGDVALVPFAPVGYLDPEEGPKGPTEGHEAGGFDQEGSAYTGDGGAGNGSSGATAAATAPLRPKLACRHGSLTAEEMLVPLAAAGRLGGDV